jgi:hypothetical protein
MAHLEMKITCEKCGKAVPITGEAYICSYECTFCTRCASEVHNLCPNCGGELVRRPLRNLTSSLAQAGRADLSALDKGVGLVCLASIAAWGFIAISGGLSMYELARSLGHETSFRMNFVIPGVNYLIFAFLTPFVFFLARRHPIQRNNLASAGIALSDRGSWLHGGARWT